jgi:hypothetical protein
MDTGIRAGTGINVVLLDWEKAFDKVTQKGLFTALERMSINPKLINIIKELYKNPSFVVEMEGNTSQWHTQHTGIRQGCPLSPYLFILLMTVLFHDVHEKTGAKIECGKLEHFNDSEVLYADDTMIIGKRAREVNIIVSSA